MEQGRRVVPASEEAGEELVGMNITIGKDANVRKGLVVGYRAGTGLHKVYFGDDESANEVDLANVPWARDEIISGAPSLGWRLAVMWTAKLDSDDAAERAPFEAFVVDMVGRNKYRLLYTENDELEDRDLHATRNEWLLCEQGQQQHDGRAIIGWTRWAPKLQAVDSG